MAVWVVMVVEMSRAEITESGEYGVVEGHRETETIREYVSRTIVKLRSEATQNKSSSKSTRNKTKERYIVLRHLFRPHLPFPSHNPY